MTGEGIQSFLTQVELPNWKFEVVKAGASLVKIRLYLPAANVEGAHVVESFIDVDHTWSRSDIVKALFSRLQELWMAGLAESFKYRGRPIFTQAYNVDRLWDICEETSMDKSA